MKIRWKILVIEIVNGCKNVNKRFPFLHSRPLNIQFWQGLRPRCLDLLLFQPKKPCFLRIDSGLRKVSLFYIFGVSSLVQGVGEERNSAKLLDRYDILKISYFVRMSRLYSVQALTSRAQLRDVYEHWKTGSMYRITLSSEYRLYLATLHAGLTSVRATTSAI